METEGGMMGMEGDTTDGKEKKLSEMGKQLVLTSHSR